MSKISKAIEKMRSNPKDWRIESLENIAEHFNIDIRKSGGSHVVFMHENSGLVVTVPAKRPIKPIYIKLFLELLDDVGETMNEIDYPFEMCPLSDDEGGGWLISFPDLPGCISDGDTPEEAIQNGKDALNCWLLACKESGRAIPKPNDSKNFAANIPENLYRRLSCKAKKEGISINVLISDFITQCLANEQNEHLETHG